MQGASVVCDDGTRGTVVAEETPGQLVVSFNDGSHVIVAAALLVHQNDGSYSLPAGAPRLAGAVASEEVVIPVVAEELTVETQRVARAKVHVHKRIETREEVVDTPVVVEEVVVEHIPVNKVVEGDVVPTVREEAGVLVIPVIEEVLVVHKQLVVREEVRVFKRRRTTTTPQTVVLRREIVEIRREDMTGEELQENQETSRTEKEHQS